MHIAAVRLARLAQERERSVVLVVETMAYGARGRVPAVVSAGHRS